MALPYAIPVWGVSDCDQIITVPNGTSITLNQAIMAVKTQQDLRSPLFLGVDTQPDGSVIVTCDKSVKEEAEVFISHLAIHLEQIFGVAIWEALPMTTKKACRLSHTVTKKMCC